jgi:S1-C subfamily serine protease
LEIPVLEKKDQMDSLADLTNHETNIINRLGILALPLTDHLRTSLGVDFRIPSGVIVLARAAELISPDTGLQQGDVIHTLNQKPIDSLDTLRAMVRALKPGDPVAMQIERDGGLQYVSFEME